MKTRYRLIRRGIRSDAFYCVDKQTGKRVSLQTTSEDEASQIVQAKNQAERQRCSTCKSPKPSPRVIANQDCCRGQVPLVFPRVTQSFAAAVPISSRAIQLANQDGWQFDTRPLSLTKQGAQYDKI